jgi:hypothetical protein
MDTIRDMWNNIEVRIINIISEAFGDSSKHLIWFDMNLNINANSVYNLINGPLIFNQNCLENLLLIYQESQTFGETKLCRRFEIDTFISTSSMGYRCFFVVYTVWNVI